MSAAHETEHVEAPKPLEPPTAGTMVAYAAAAVVAILFARFVPHGGVAVVAAGIAALLPMGRGTNVRIAFAAMAAALALFVTINWPGAAEAIPEAATTPEPKTLLSWLIGLPIAGAIAMLFAPRQAHKFLQVTTMLIMVATLFVSMPLLSVSMGSGYHFNHDVPWLPTLGIHYHVALDGISL